MREVIDDILQWTKRGDDQIAVATVVQTWGSAPRQAGSKFAFTPARALSGSVSGGCIEGAVFDAGIESLDAGRSRVIKFGVADETAFDTVGLACGGSIEVLVEPLAPATREAWRRAAQGEYGVSAATLVEGPYDWIGARAIESDVETDTAGLWPADLPEPVRAALRGAARDGLRSGTPVRVSLAFAGPGGEPLTAFVDPQLPAPTVMCVGGVHIAIALAQIARAVGYRTVIIDPRAAFGNRARFPDVDALVAKWPAEALADLRITRATAVVTLTHDARIDDDALMIALASPAFYVGALGGTLTNARRVERLRGAGVADEQLARLHAPIGLEIGTVTPEEIALATMAEIVQTRAKGK